MQGTRGPNSGVWIWAIPPLYVLLHGIIATCLPSRLDALSTVCIVLAEWGAVAVSIRAAKQSGHPARALWLLLSGSILLHSVAMTLDVLAETTGATEFNFVPGFQIFFSMLSSVPMLVAVSLQSDRRTAKIARIAYSLISLAIGAVLYLQLFTILTVSGSQNPADAILIMHLFDAIDLFLAAAATVRWLGAEQPQEVQFFRVLSIFLWIDALLPAIHNRIILRHDYVWLDLFLSAPYLILCALMLRSKERSVRVSSPRVSRVIRSGSPIFLTMALVTVGLFAIRSHFYIGLGAVLFAVATYGALNVLIQTRGLEAEATLLADKRLLERLAVVDGLTGIANRRGFDKVFHREFSAARRGGTPLSLLMIDVDHFKEVNDELGHQVGDEYLIQIAQALRRALPRVTDIVARYGGEEFTAILPATGSAGAVHACEKLHDAIRHLGLHHPTAKEGIVTISIGVSTFDGSAAIAAQRLVEAADRALYLAKSGGRNRSESMEPDETTV
ncbi:GGDEF domain-containing protein [Occallatibacter riparius]|uniref:diguanylate cyclase n=1 Tax=Occallatibacter riparius TaxID=1002689 RepID=A0A9J7BU76_9BACT|nr:GGDEF domain-containing protein [Occallatibacter riparius]UWZ86435.1 GGDEF domain-containing protein [Occallatibacter riparius]